jgi:hypothetical protein
VKRIVRGLQFLWLSIFLVSISDFVANAQGSLPVNVSWSISYG